MGKRLCVVGLVLLLLPLAGILSAQPTLEEVRAAVKKGVEWLVLQQNPDGSFGSYGYPDSVGVTGLAVKKLMHYAVDPKYGLYLPSPFDPRYPYVAQVEKGLGYLFANAGKTAIGVQPAGNPDSNGNNLGIHFGPLGSWRESYTTGIALMAVCEAVELDRKVAAGPLAGMTYLEVAQDTMDFLAFGQVDAGPPHRGGWGYVPNLDWADNSNSGYVTLGLGFAEIFPPGGCGLSIPAFVKTELNLWIDYIQNDVNGDPEDGGSGYNAPDNWVNTLKTGNLLQQMALYGDGPLTPRVQHALAYLKRHWQDANLDPGWGWSVFSANYQATFTIMKGLKSLFPLDAEMFDGIEWGKDFETALVAQQQPEGSWPRTFWDGGPTPVLSTTWALLTLQRAAPVFAVPVDIRPASCRNPLNVAEKGVLPVAILGTSAFDVAQVDPTTVKLEGMMPLRWSFEDVGTPYVPFINKPIDPYACNAYGADGYMDLSLKFDAQAVVAALGPVSDGEVRILKLSAQLKPAFGSRFIAGEDVVVILKKKP